MPRAMSAPCAHIAILATALLACLLCLSGAQAHMVEMAPYGRDCFFEDLHIGDQMTLSYQVGGSTYLDIDATLTDPTGHALYEQARKDTGSYSFVAAADGRFEYCFSNQYSSVADKTISFNVHGIIYVAEEGDMSPVEREVRDLAAGVQAIKDEQAYLVVRERLHRNTAESTNSRVRTWSIVQALMLAAVCGVQIFFVKRHFEVQRII